MDSASNGPMTGVAVAKERLRELGARPSPVRELFSSPAFLGGAAVVVGSLFAGGLSRRRRSGPRDVLSRCALMAAPLLLRQFIAGMGQHAAPAKHAPDAPEREGSSPSPV